MTVMDSYESPSAPSPQMKANLPPQCKGMLIEYFDVFPKPKGWPPYKEFDQRIHLQPSSAPINVRLYSSNEDAHVEHLRQVLQLLRQHKFFAKATMTQWPQPQSMKQLHGFLSLTGYYRRFMQHYATIAAPLTELLKKDNFQWSLAKATAFEKLKKSMTETHVLKLPDFTKEFVVETLLQK
uniref:Reverse transcriptase/retrotransposon-derived protein RNase H-like domain-containing protein n=1 Tax=Cannabis sativa TaxID=3483 RepID=A0A803NWP5_CANSA